MFVIWHYMEKKKRCFIWIFKSFFLFPLAFGAIKSLYVRLVERGGSKELLKRTRDGQPWCMKGLCLHRGCSGQHSSKSVLYVECLKIVAFFFYSRNTSTLNLIYLQSLQFLFQRNVPVMGPPWSDGHNQHKACHWTQLKTVYREIFMNVE